MLPDTRSAQRWSIDAGQESGKQLAKDALDIILLAAVLLAVALVAVL